MSVIPAFGLWTEQDHLGGKQERSIESAQKAETTPITVDRKAKTAVFFGSGKDPYNTSLSFCNCSGFARTKAPCKHIYRLAMELGIIDLPFKTGMSKGERLSMQITFEDALPMFEAFSPDAQQMAVGMLSHWKDGRHNIHLVTDPAIATEFRACPLMDETEVPPSEALGLQRRTDMFDIVSKSGIECPYKKNVSKSTLAKWIVENVPNLPDFLPFCTSFSYIDNFDMAQDTILKHFYSKFPSFEDL